jgi:hypothetical protein
MGSSKESLEKKNVSAEKYDEIRRLDGNVQGMTNRISKATNNLIINEHVY